MKMAHKGLRWFNVSPYHADQLHATLQASIEFSTTILVRLDCTRRNCPCSVQGQHLYQLLRGSFKTCSTNKVYDPERENPTLRIELIRRGEAPA